MGRMESFMPTYTIKNTETEEEWDEVCSWDQLQETLEKNPAYKHVLKAPKIVSGHKDIFAKQPDSFKDLKRNMHKHAGRNSRIKV